MSHPDYTKFDAELLLMISAGINRMALLENNKLLTEMAEPLCGNEGKPLFLHTPTWRVIDRRLQALRKAGKIRHNGKFWELVKK